MKRFAKAIAGLMLMLGLTACHTSRRASVSPATGAAAARVDRKAVARAEQALGLAITSADYLPLYLEAAEWVGTPHRLGASTKQRGADCSGMTQAIYRDVYGKQLERSSAAMWANNCTRIARKELREGDLLFFKHNPDGPVSHVGIYLKEGAFIHVSSKAGARVDRLDHPYYVRTFYRAGRVK